MKIGIFLDFDGVLTPKSVNMQIAAKLGKEKELIELEKRFASGALSSNDFGNSLVPLFREANFREDDLAANFTNIQLAAYATDIIQEFIDDVHIVTSSPNYYIDSFCRKYEIPPQRYICSEYMFDRSGLIKSSTKPCTVQDKRKFVQGQRGAFDLTVGVGNSVEQDGPFLSLCDIGILMGEKRSDYLSATDLESVLSLLRAIKMRAEPFLKGSLAPAGCRDGVRRLLKKSRYERNVFIITPYRLDARYNACIKAIKDALSDGGYFGYLASDDTLSREGDLWQNVQTFMYGCKFGIAVVTAHETESENQIRVEPEILNPNVIAEIGYMLGLAKNVLLLKDKRVKLPTDWMGKLFEGFDLKNPEAEIRAAVETWIKRIAGD